MSLQDQLRAFDLAWGDLRKVSNRDDVKAALNWAWSPGHHQETPDGQIRNTLEQAVKEVKEDVLAWIKSKCGDFSNPEEAFDEFRETLKRKDSTQLYKLARGHDTAVQDMPERVRVILKRAKDEDTQKRLQEPGAIRRCVMFEYIAAQLAVASRSLVGQTQTNLRVLVDSNIILDMILRESRKHKELVSTFRALSTVGARLEFLVTTRTAAEVRWRLNNDLNVLLSVQARVGKKDVDENEARKALHELTDATREYLLSSRNGGTWSEFADQKMSEALGVAYGPISTPGWNPEIVRMLDERELQDEDAREAWNALVENVRKDPGWREKRRRREVDEHDIALIKQVLTSDGAGSMTIWSRHRGLTDLAAIVAEQMGISRISLENRSIPVVTLGHCLFPWAVGVGVTIDVTQARRAYREALFPLQSDETAEYAQLSRAVERLNWLQGAMEDANAEAGERELSLMASGEGSDEFRDELRPDWQTHPQWREDRKNAPEVPAEWLQPEKPGTWIDLSLKFAQSSGGHLVHAPARTTTGRRLPQWELPIHAVTHVDLPWALLEREARQPPNFPRSSDVPAHALRSLMLRPRTMEAVVLDYRDKQRAIEQHLESESEGTVYLKSEDGATLKDLIKTLAIDSASIEERLTEIGETADAIENKCVIIHTGWIDRFMPSGEDLAGIGKEMSAAVLVHPWLTHDAADLLRRMNTASLAIDCHMADNPGYLALGTDKKEVEEALREMRQESTTDDGFKFFLPHQPIHCRLLGRGALLFELLNIPDSPISDWYGNDERAFTTQVYVAFLHHAQLMDGAICKMLMRKPRHG